MYTKKELQDLRDLLIKKINRCPDYRPGGATVFGICEILMENCDPQKFESYMSYMANLAKCASTGPEDIDYKLSYDLFFGDISSAPLHINDAFELIAVWRLKSPNSPMERYPCIHENS
jgi:hypothetical protein